MLLGQVAGTVEARRVVDGRVEQVEAETRGEEDTDSRQESGQLCFGELQPERAENSQKDLYEGVPAQLVPGCPARHTLGEAGQAREGSCLTRGRGCHGVIQGSHEEQLLFGLAWVVPVVDGDLSHSTA
ncbi:hypothetical protein Raf01_42790 [Rugosimonospora africana]|uniref:Uncharacterized protein n=1 Tax=Rugosimonospora africana TaxID=556532 RepID=A0A8J3VRG5_9ACTN|nr:hypothetical protein Raf01_42790 [Rugosimonospora africana]